MFLPSSFEPTCQHLHCILGSIFNIVVIVDMKCIFKCITHIPCFVGASFCKFFHFNNCVLTSLLWYVCHKLFNARKEGVMLILDNGFYILKICWIAPHNFEYSVCLRQFVHSCKHPFANVLCTLPSKEVFIVPP